MELGTLEIIRKTDCRFIKAVSVYGVVFGAKYAICAMRVSGGGATVSTPGSTASSQWIGTRAAGSLRFVLFWPHACE